MQAVSPVSPAPAAAGIAGWDRSRLRTAVKLLLLGIVMFAVMWYRRPEQFLIPAVWVEDGTLNIPDYLANGWASLFNPIQGYYSLPIKLLHALAQTLSFRWLPEIGFWLVMAFTYGVLATVALAPTTLRLPFVCAALTLAIPCDSEVFAVSLYAGWWGSLLALPPLFWRENGKPRTTLRLALVAFGGLSSPLAIGLAPLYALRALVRRTPVDFIASGVSAATAIAQYTALRAAGAIGDNATWPAISAVVEKFFGYFIVQSTTPGLPGWTNQIGAALIAFIAVAWFLRRRELGLTFILLGGALAAAIVASSTRVPIELIHPKQAGPRYFFYPFILLTWMLVQLAALEREVLRMTAAIILALAARNAMELAQRHHEPIDWRAHVDMCLATPQHAFPIHFGGALSNVWPLSLTNDQCRQLVAQSWFDNNLPR